jgi:hypothetical protein
MSASRHFRGMAHEEAEKIRQQARECRRLAADTRSSFAQDYLIFVADELETEAAIIDGRAPEGMESDPEHPG